MRNISLVSDVGTQDEGWRGVEHNDEMGHGHNCMTKQRILGTPNCGWETNFKNGCSREKL